MECFYFHSWARRNRRGIILFTISSSEVQSNGDANKALHQVKLFFFKCYNYYNELIYVLLHTSSVPCVCVPQFACARMKTNTCFLMSLFHLNCFISVFRSTFQHCYQRPKSVLNHNLRKISVIIRKKVFWFFLVCYLIAYV